MPHSLEVILLIGLPGSGKSSFYRVCFAATHRHLSKDNWPNAKRREARLQRELRATLQDGRSVVIDNTNVTREARQSVLNIAREFNVRVSGYVFKAHFEECLQRNAGREGKARVPDAAIKIMHANWQAPIYAEGFDELFWVQLCEGAFWITSYDEPATV